jgi:protein SCO1/2
MCRSAWRRRAILAREMTSAARTDTERPAQGPGLRMLLPIAVVAAILAAVTLLLVGGSSKPTLPGNAGTAHSAAFDGLVLQPPQPSPPLNTLRNYDGSSFDLAADRGKAVFVTFLYSHCPDVCPLIAANLHNAYSRMPAALQARVGIVSVSADPRGDSAGAVAAFMRSHRLSGEARYLIGSASQLAPVWEAWKVGSQQDASNPQLVNHSALVYGIGASGKIYTIYAANFTPDQIIHDTPQLLGL